jgi:two-component system, NtrC family, response regulator HupR/HoxA
MASVSGALLTEALECLNAYDWPGNIRERQNESVRMLVLAPRDRLGAELLPARMLQAAPPG